MLKFKSEAPAIKDTIYDIDFLGEDKNDAIEIASIAIEEFDKVLTILHHQGISRERVKEILSNSEFQIVNC